MQPSRVRSRVFFSSLSRFSVIFLFLRNPSLIITYNRNAVLYRSAAITAVERSNSLRILFTIAATYLKGR